jgi:plastocyanin
MRVATFAIAVSLIVCAIGLAAGERAKPQTHTVTIEGMRFQPESLTIARGDTVVWVNNDLVPHTATSEAGSFDSQIIQPEKSWKFTASKKGEFAYTCTFHPTMKGMLQVK